MTDQPKLILLVEDSFPQAKALFCHLEAAGYQVTVAGNGADAWECAQQQQYSLVLTDYHLPDGVCSHLCQRLRQDERYAQTPIILLTGYEHDLDVPRLTESLDLWAVFPKPFHPEEIVGKVRECLDRSTANVSQDG